MQQPRPIRITASGRIDEPGGFRLPHGPHDVRTFQRSPSTVPGVEDVRGSLTEPGEVDLLAVPVNAPWAKVAETIEFVRRVQPRTGIIPIHDALLSPTGRGMYLKHIGDFGADDGVTVLDLKDQGPTRC